MECHKIRESWEQKGSLREKKGLGLFIGLWPKRVHATMHREAFNIDACGLFYL